MSKKIPAQLPEQHLLALHASIESESLWDASRRLLHRCFENHFIVVGFAFLGNKPMIIKRGKPAPPRDAEWWARNCANHPLIYLLIERPELKIIRVTDIITAEDIKQLPYYHEFMVPDGWLYSVGVFIREGDRVIGMLSVNRREEQGDFTAEEMALFDRLQPHFETAFRRVCRIQACQAATVSLASMLSRFPLPVAVVSWQGEINHINDPGRQACLDWNTSHPGQSPNQNLSLATLPPEIRERCIEIARRIDLDNTTNHDRVSPTKEILHHPRLPELSVGIEIVPHHSEPMAAPAFLIRFERDTTAPFDPATLLSRFFQLSTAEKAVANHIFEGLSNSEIARRLGKSTSTVKKQSESIYRKLGIHDRRRLIAIAPALQLALDQRESPTSD